LRPRAFWHRRNVRVAEDPAVTDEKPFVNPMRQQFEELRAKHPELASYADYALANLNDVDPQEVLNKLPPKYLELIRHTITRSLAVIPLPRRAIEAHCYIEALVLCHGVIQMCLRTLYVCAWQRIAPIVVALVMLSVLVNSGTTKLVATGTVAVFKVGESISLTSGGMAI
jgi:hypothetical protein